MAGVDPALVRGWLAARSLSRGLPAPVADRGGWRVDTGSAEEHRRHVFAAPGPGLAACLATIDRPRVLVKLCADAATFAAWLPPHWSITDANCMMVPTPAACRTAAVPPGYRLSAETDGPVTRVVVAAPDGTPAASGHGAACDGVFAYDRIVTHEGHRRRGLGKAVMAALGATRDPAAREILTATAMGQKLYASLGWQVYAPYTTAARADVAAPGRPDQ